MSQSEKAIMADILLDLSAMPETLVYRNNTGMAWQGEKVDRPVGGMVKVEAGMVILRRARPVRFGLVGSGDIHGAHESLPLAVEVKDEDGRQRTEQGNFERAWRKAGGIYILARSVAETREKLAEAKAARIV